MTFRIDQPAGNVASAAMPWPTLRERVGLVRRLRAAAAALAVLGATAAPFPAAAQHSPQDMKDGAEMMVGVGALCADYLKKPEILETMRRRAVDQLLDIGMSQGEADAFMDKAAVDAIADPSNQGEVQMQLACEMAGVKAMDVQ